MNLGQLLGGAGVVGQGMRQAEEAERIARQNQLAIEEQNRAADLKKQLAGLQMPSFQPVDVAQFTQQFMPGQTMPMGAAPAPAAPAAPVPAPGLQLPVQARPEAPNQSAVESARLARSGTPTGAGVAPYQNLAGFTPPAGMTGPQNLAALREARMQRFAAPAAQVAAVPMTKQERFAELQRKNEVAPTVAPVAPAAAGQLPDSQRLLQAMIAVESAGRPDAVSPKGAVGLMQVMPASAMNPGYGLPDVFDFAQQMGAQVGKRNEAEAKRLLADPTVGAAYGLRFMDAMLQKYNGNLEYALAAYNAGPGRVDKWLAAGADFNELPKETREYIPKVLAAITPTTTPAAGATPAPGAAPGAAPSAPPAALEVPQTQARNMEMAEYYLAKPESIPYELQQLNQMAQQQAAFLTRQRNETAQLAQVYLRSGTQQGIDAAMRLRENIGQIDASLLQIQQQVGQKQMYLQGMQGLRELATANDPRRLSGVLSQMLGVPVAFQPRPDGKWNHFVNGQKVAEGLTTDAVASGALRDFSPEARAASAQSAALKNELALKLQYDPGIKTAQINAIARLYEARTKGEYDLAVEANKKLGIDVKPTGDGSGRLAIIKDGRTLLMLDTAEVKKEQTPFGEITLPPTARRVGIDVGR